MNFVQNLYVDDIFIICEHNHKYLHELLNDINSKESTIQFTLQIKLDNKQSILHIL